MNMAKCTASRVCLSAMAAFSRQPLVLTRCCQLWALPIIVLSTLRLCYEAAVNSTFLQMCIAILHAFAIAEESMQQLQMEAVHCRFRNKYLPLFGPYCWKKWLFR